MMQMTSAKRALAAIWVVGAAVVFFSVLIPGLSGRYEPRASEVYSFILPTFIPTLSLVIGVLVMDEIGKGVQTHNVSPFLFRLTAGLSVAYLLILLCVIVIGNVRGTIFEVITQANFFLAPIQGLVSAAMGAFFVIAPDKQTPLQAVATGGSPPDQPINHDPA